MSSRIDCWNLIYHMPPQLRSLFIIKEDPDQWEHLSAGSFRLSPLSVRLIASHSPTTCNTRTESVWKKRTWITITAAHICSDTLPQPASALWSSSSPRTDEKMRALVSELPPSLVLLFNWSFIGDNQFIPTPAPGCIDLLSWGKVKCALPLPPNRLSCQLQRFYFSFFSFFFKKLLASPTFAACCDSKQN